MSETNDNTNSLDVDREHSQSEPEIDAPLDALLRLMLAKFPRELQIGSDVERNRDGGGTGRYQLFIRIRCVVSGKQYSQLQCANPILFERAIGGPAEVLRHFIQIFWSSLFDSFLAVRD